MRIMRPVADLLCLLVFVAIGRRTHDHGLSFQGIASTAGPFVVGLIVGWYALRRRHRGGETLMEGEVVVLFTVAVGMVLRVIVGQGTAFAFIVVALVFLSAFMLGWRLVQRFVT